MNTTDESQPVSLHEILRILNRRRTLILSTFVAVAVAVAVATFLLPKQYESRMKILVKNERADPIVSASPSGNDFRGEVGEAQINSEIELLNSDDLLTQVVKRCALAPLEVAGDTAPASQPLASDKAVRRLHRDLKIAPVRKANIIQVEYLAGDPHRAAAVLRVLAETYLESHLKVHGTPGTYQFFKDQTTRYQGQVQDAEAELAAFRRREDVVMLSQQKDVMLQKSSESESALLQTEAAIAEYTRKTADTRVQLAAIAPRVMTQNRTVPNQYSVERLHTMLAELQNRRTLLLSKFRPEDRVVQEATQEIADTRAALEKAETLTGVEQATDVNPLYQSLQIDLSKEQAELAGLQARRQSLQQQTGSYKGRLLRYANATAAYDDLVRNQKEAEDRYLLYAKKTEEARIAESLDQQKIANVAIAESPTESQIPTKPNVPLNLGLGVLLAGFLSLGVAFAAEYFLDTVTQPAELEELTGLPVLATVRRLSSTRFLSCITPTSGLRGRTLRRLARSPLLLSHPATPRSGSLPPLRHPSAPRLRPPGGRRRPGQNQRTLRPRADAERQGPNCVPAESLLRPGHRP